MLARALIGWMTPQQLEETGAWRVLSRWASRQTGGQTIGRDKSQAKKNGAGEPRKNNDKRR